MGCNNENKELHNGLGYCHILEFLCFREQDILGNDTYIYTYANSNTYNGTGRLVSGKFIS